MLNTLYEFWSDNPVNFTVYSLLMFLLGTVAAGVMLDIS